MSAHKRVFVPRVAIAAAMLAMAGAATARPVPQSPESDLSTRVEQATQQLSAEISARLDQQLEARLAARENPLATRWSDEAAPRPASNTVINGSHGNAVFLSR